jgi:hypothetical protein
LEIGSNVATTFKNKEPIMAYILGGGNSESNGFEKA